MKKLEIIEAANEQLELIKQLIKNKNLLILNNESTKEEDRNQLIKSNNFLVQELMNFEIKPFDNQSLDDEGNLLNF